MKNFYETPTQVMFFDIDCGDGEYKFGIAWGSSIICGCCGGIFEIDEVIEFTPDEFVPIYDYSTWNDLSEEIFGGEYPDGYQPQDNEG